jgi:hypothetical protein
MGAYAAVVTAVIESELGHTGKLDLKLKHAKVRYMYKTRVKSTLSHKPLHK